MYFELIISQNPKYDESVYLNLYKNGIKNILEEYGFIKVYFKENEKKKIQNLITSLKNEVNIPPNNINLTKIPSYDWNKEWRNSLKPIYIKDKLIIFPSWKKNIIKNKTDKILIEINPKMSFGTGYSETTQLILEMMAMYVTPSDKFLLDFGCGTGILAIAGIKLGSTRAVAIDFDKDSIRDALESFKKNKTANKIKLYESDIKNIYEKDFNIIVCNIDSLVIIKNLLIMKRKLRKCGKLILSGFMNEEIDKLSDKIIKNGFKIIETRSKGEWSAIYAIKL